MRREINALLIGVFSEPRVEFCGGRVMLEERVGWSLIRGALVIRRRSMVLISCFHNRQLVERTQKKQHYFKKIFHR